jgi:hypothetical protein
LQIELIQQRNDAPSLYLDGTRGAATPRLWDQGFRC